MPHSHSTCNSCLGVGVIVLATLSEHIYIYISIDIPQYFTLCGCLLIINGCTFTLPVIVFPGSEVLGEETRYLELRMQALREQEDSEVLHHAALLGNLSVIREYLDKYPNEVTTYITNVLKLSDSKDNM